LIIANDHYRFSQFKVVYQLEKTGHMSAPVFEFSEVQRQDMEQKGFPEPL